MELIRNSQKICYNLIKNQPVENWIDHNSSNRTIKFYLFAILPYLNYFNLSSTHYRYCGPMLAFAEHFTKKTKTR